MKLIETYKKVIEYQLQYTLMGTEQFAEVGNLDRIRLFIFPELDKLEIGKEIPENLKKLSNGYMVNLSYTFATKFYPLYLNRRPQLASRIPRQPCYYCLFNITSCK